MFSGIIQDLGLIIDLKKHADSIDFYIQTSMINDLILGQSISHNGICLTIVRKIKNHYVTTAIDETIKKTTIQHWNVEQQINLEKSLIYGDLIDGHIVQGHIDCVGICANISKNKSGYIFRFKYPSENQDLICEQGSIAINGVSLTIVKLLDKTFELEVAIIPHTFEHTTFKNIKMNDLVNLEFDPFAKQIKRHISLLKL